jgi:hypothetical protein
MFERSCGDLGLRRCSWRSWWGVFVLLVVFAVVVEVYRVLKFFMLLALLHGPGLALIVGRHLRRRLSPREHA